MLAAYEEPLLNAGMNDALLDYIACLEREIPTVDVLNNGH